MKTFFNVLYRRILYKIPLKFLLILLVIIAIFIASFSNAGLDLIDSVTRTEYNPDGNFTYNGNSDLICVVVNYQCGKFWFKFTNEPYAYNLENLYAGQMPNNFGICTTANFINYGTENTCTFTFNVYKFNEYTSLECQTQYSLIPVSSVDQNYCTSNNLCPAQYTESQCKSVYGLIDESECTGGGSGLNLSELYINNILHVGAPTIFMNIPEEINREYAYTQGGNVMNIDVFGYNVDYEKIQSIIDKQSYIPTDEDFQNIILLIGPYGKIIIFFVFLFILWAWIKKPFKSKL